MASEVENDTIVPPQRLNIGSSAATWSRSVKFICICKDSLTISIDVGERLLSDIFPGGGFLKLNMSKPLEVGTSLNETAGERLFAASIYVTVLRLFIANER